MGDDEEEDGNLDDLEKEEEMEKKEWLFVDNVY